MSNTTSRFQKFAIARIHRGQLANATYNPRTIDKHARKKLKEKISKAGLVSPITWNKRTGNIVSGHQRLSILDDLEGGTDYWLDVAVIDVDDRRERELNVFLNNQSAMGEFDLEALQAMVAECDAAALGFDEAELQLMFDDEQLAPIFSDAKDAAKGSIESINAMKERRKAFKDGQRVADQSEYYTVVVFATDEDREKFHREAKLPPDDKYVDGRRLATLLGLEL